MFHEPLAAECGFCTKTTDEGVGKSVGNLQTDAEEHGKEEEERHSLVAEELKRIESHGLHQAFFLAALVYGARRQGQSVGSQHQTPESRDKKLHMRLLPTQQVDDPHRNNEADGAEDADGREIFHGVESGTLKRIVRHGVRQRQGGHVGRDTERVPRENVGKRNVFSHADPANYDHKGCSQEMTKRQHALCLHETVGNHADKGGHKDGNYPLDGIKPPDIGSHFLSGQKSPHGSEVSSPHSEL